MRLVTIFANRRSIGPNATGVVIGREAKTLDVGLGESACALDELASVEMDGGPAESHWPVAAFRMKGHVVVSVWLPLLWWSIEWCQDKELVM